jgi:hypothetical protein
MGENICKLYEGLICRRCKDLKNAEDVRILKTQQQNKMIKNGHFSKEDKQMGTGT